MKKTLFSLFISSLFFMSCEGPAGPQGPIGPQGADGLLGEVYEVKASFNTSNKFSAGFDFKPAIYESDKVVGYILEGDDGQGNDNWEPLPQTFFINGNTFLYTFDFSKTGFTLFLDGNADLNMVSANARTNRIFRMLVIPAKLVGKVNLNNINDVMAKMGIQEADIVNIH